MTSKRFAVWLALLYAAGVLIFCAEALLLPLHPEWKGLVPYRGGDETQYIIRLNKALLFPGTDVSNGADISETADRGAQEFFPEQVAGFLLSWTGLSGPLIALILSALLGPLILVLLAVFLKGLNTDQWTALGLAALYFVVLITPLRRTVHYSWTLPYVLLTLILLQRWWRSPTIALSIGLGVLLGVATKIYFWHWTFLWAATGSLLLLAWFQKDRRPLYLKQGALIGLVTIIVAIPAFISLHDVASHPDFAAAGARSQLILGHHPESLPRTALLVLLTASLLYLIRKQKKFDDWGVLCAGVIGMTIAMNQQLVHGRILAFSSHYYPIVCLLAVGVLAVLWKSYRRNHVAWIALVVSAAFLLMAFIDYGRSWLIFPASPGGAVQFQYLAPLVHEERNNGRTDRFVSDPETALALASYVPDDTVFTIYMRHTLMSTSELAERYCLTQIFAEQPDVLWLAHQLIENSPGLREGEEAYLSNLAITEEACVQVRNNPEEMLQKYGVSAVLWNEKTQTWIMQRPYLQKRTQGEGWSVWDITGGEPRST